MCQGIFFNFSDISFSVTKCLVAAFQNVYRGKCLNVATAKNI